MHHELRQAALADGTWLSATLCDFAKAAGLCSFTCVLIGLLLASG